MQTERLKRLRACAGGCGVSARMAASARSSQTRATLLLGADRETTAAPQIVPKTSPNVVILVRRTEPLLMYVIFMVNILPRQNATRVVPWDKRHLSLFLPKVKQIRGKTLKWRGEVTNNTNRFFERSPIWVR